MSATPENVEHLAAAIRRVDGSHDLGAAALAEALLETGAVEVKVPEPAPTYQPGDVAIATVHDVLEPGDVTGQLIVRRGVGPAPWSWPAKGQVLFDHEVTVTSRAIVVSESDVGGLTTAVYSVVRDYYSQFHNVISEWFAAKLGGSR